MKSLSLTQPWATLVAIGAKRIETRSWSTTYRGLLAIQAAKGFPRNAQALCYTHPFAPHLARATALNRPGDLPRGVIVAVVRLVDVVRMPARVTYELRSTDGARRYPLSAHERAFGDYSYGRYAWILEDVTPVSPPILFKGALGLRDVPADVAVLLPTLFQEAITS